MKLNRRWRNQSLQLATAGMIDIVFLLLIFFLVNSSFKPAERQIESRLTDPQARSSEMDDEPLVVEVEVQSGITFRVGGQTFPDQQELREWLRQWPSKSQTVLVKAPAACPVQIPVTLLNDCRQAGFESVAYLPPNEQEYGEWEENQ